MKAAKRRRLHRIMLSILAFFLLLTGITAWSIRSKSSAMQTSSTKIPPVALSTLPPLPTDDLPYGWCRNVNQPIDKDSPKDAAGIEAYASSQRTQCPLRRSVVCNRHKPAESQLERKSNRALVLYMMTTQTDPYLSQGDWDNFDHFLLTGGVIPENTATELFDAVDYVFIKVSTKISSIVECGRDRNIRLLMLPMGPCDLCAHSRALDYLGVNDRSSVYRQVILLNSGVRGPWLREGSSSWIDVLSMTGFTHRQWSTERLKKDQLVAGATSISWEVRPHPQSFFLSLAIEHLAVITPLFAATCQRGKLDCILEGETMIGVNLLKAGYPFYSFAQNFTFSDMGHSKEYEAKYGRFPADRPNPTKNWIDPCDVIFSKFGGEVWRQKVIPQSVIRAVQRLSLYPGSATSPAAAMINHTVLTCDWFRHD